MRRSFFVTFGLALGVGVSVALAAFLRPAQAQSYVQVGILECSGGPSVGLVVGSENTFGCVLKDPGGASIDYYVAVSRRIGLDIGISNDTLLVWAVYAPVRQIGRGDLVGNYAGASGNVAVGIGAGANVLVGGSNNSFALQPLSVQGQVGLNLAVGVTSLELRAGRPAR